MSYLPITCKYTIINANNLSCITHQLNIIKYITKQYHEMAIEYLSLFVGRLLLSASSSSSFIIALFLIQMLRWIRGSSRVESFVFLIVWGIFFGWWELDLQLLPSSYYESSFFFFLESVESNHFLLAHIPLMNESHDPGRPFKVVITISSFSTYSFTA